MKAKSSSINVGDRVKELLARKLPEITEEEKKELAWKGKFEPIAFDIEDKPGATLSEKYDVFAMMRGYENEASEILRAKGYTLPLEELTGSKDRQIRDLMRMHLEFREVRIYIGLNDAARAALAMAYGVRSAMLARIRPLTKSQSIKASKPRRKIGKNPEDSMTPEKRAKRNDAINAAFKDWGKTDNAFYIKYGKKHNLSPSAIRKIVKS